MAKSEIQQWGVYGYVATRKIEPTEIQALPALATNFKSGLTIDTIQEGEIVYIGIDREINTKRRHREHTSPSSLKEGGINYILQTMPEDTFKYFQLATLHVDSKELAYLIETNSINEFKPIFNRKVKK